MSSLKRENRIRPELYLCLFLLAIVSLQQKVFSAESCLSISAPLTFQKLAAKIQECEIRRIEDLLPLLPPDFRSRYLLVYASRSLQEATPKFPRVILFGLDARIILTFAGDPHLEGYESLETIEFDDQRKIFRFRSITFPADKAQTLEDVQKKPVVSAENPQRCMMCHRQDPRPNWDSYAAWPGVYGSRNDVMPAAEEEQYQNFKDQVFMKVGRYRFFEDANKYPDDAWYYDYYPWPRPNLQFNWLLSLLNSQANARALKESRKLYPFRYALLASLTCQDELAEMIPPAITAGFEKSYLDIHEEVKKSIEASYAEREKRQLLLLHSLGSRASLEEWDTQFPRKEMEYAAATSRLRYVMEMAGVPFPKWSMEFGSRNDVFFAGPVGQVGELGLFLWQELLDPAGDHEIYQIYLDAWQNRRLGEMKFWYGTEDLCNALRQKSLKALNAKNLSRIRN